MQSEQTILKAKQFPNMMIFHLIIVNIVCLSSFPFS